MINKIEEKNTLPLLEDFLKQIEAETSLKGLEALRVAWLGKQGLVTQELKKLGHYAPEERKEHGAQLNALRTQLEAALDARQAVLERQALEEQLRRECVDISLPCRPEWLGKKHLLTQISESLIDYFRSLGFRVMEGPEVDSEFYNFEVLNVPAHHPARQEQDTLYLKDIPGMLLRTHTSTMQGRTFQTTGLPVRAVSIGSVFRNDAIDATHSPMFHQIEIFVAEPGITIAHMKTCLLDLLSFLFNIDLCEQVKRGEIIPVRFRPSFFPFTEPSLEIDCCCSSQNGELKLDLNGQWMELLGCGMIHPEVFRQSGVTTFEDGSPAQGFAIGIGIERIAMLKYGITDVRYFYENDMRWLNHYGQPVERIVSPA